MCWLGGRQEKEKLIVLDMKKRITITINKDLVESAKKYASAHDTTISHLVETYLNRLCNEIPSAVEISPLVRSLSGIITLQDNYNRKEAFTRHLIGKYK